MNIAKDWWKILCLLILLIVFAVGFLIEVPRLHIINEGIRNTFFHVPMWFAMLILFGISVFYSIKYLNSPNELYSIKAGEYAKVGILFGVLGLLTGMMWARYTWGEYWSGDPKQNGSAIGLLIYMAYFVLRGAINEEELMARISAVYNIFAFSSLIPLMYILPRLTDSLHPGSGGNQNFAMIDFDNNLRLVLYPSIIGFILLGIWIGDLRVRIEQNKNMLEELSQSEL
ncbi:MAG: cytochrome c biogenesis protein CcsA [Bacteroidota bacterium]